MGGLGLALLGGALQGVGSGMLAEASERRKFALEALKAGREGQEMSTVGKEARDAGLTPGTPEFQSYVKQRLAVSDTKYIATQPGGGVAKANGSGVDFVIQPNPGDKQPGSPVSKSGPQPGEIDDGYRFKGGDAADPKNWEPVGGGPTASPSGGFR